MSEAVGGRLPWLRRLEGASASRLRDADYQGRGQSGRKGVLACTLRNCCPLLCTLAIFGCANNSHRVTAITQSHDGALLTLDSALEFRVDFVRQPYNQRNLELLYPSKLVWVVWTKAIWQPKSAGCWEISPVREASQPALSASEYDRLVRDGFTDEDLAYSFQLPTEHQKNPNPLPPTYGGTLSYGAPELCASKMSDDSL